MAVDFSGVKVGDRIRLTNRYAVIEGPIRYYYGVTADVGVSRASAVYIREDDWDTLEILEIPKFLEPPLPTEPGYYVDRDAEPDRNAELFLFIDDAEGWSSDPLGDWHFIPDEEVPRNLVRLVKEGTD